MIQAKLLFSSPYYSAEETMTTPVVFFSVAPTKQDGKSDSNPQPPRNLTVILKSVRPVRWYLESWNINGILRVISNNGPVENHSRRKPPGLHLKIGKYIFSSEFHH